MATELQDGWPRGEGRVVSVQGIFNNNTQRSIIHYTCTTVVDVLTSVYLRDPVDKSWKLLGTISVSSQAQMLLYSLD